MELKCKRCERKWNYSGAKGKQKYPEYTSCPRCKNTVRVLERKK
jgi:hypothetical protein